VESTWPEPPPQVDADAAAGHPAEPARSPSAAPTAGGPGDIGHDELDRIEADLARVSESLRLLDEAGLDEGGIEPVEAVAWLGGDHV
jgi:hypothetical protein